MENTASYWETHDTAMKHFQQERLENGEVTSAMVKDVNDRITSMLTVLSLRDIIINLFIMEYGLDKNTVEGAEKEIHRIRRSIVSSIGWERKFEVINLIEKGLDEAFLNAVKGFREMGDIYPKEYKITSLSFFMVGYCPWTLLELLSDPTERLLDIWNSL